MEVLNLSRQGLWDLHSECLGGLRKESLLDIAIRHPYNLAAVVVKARNDMRNIHGFATLIQQLTVENRVPLRVRFQLLVHDADDGIRRCGYESCFYVHANVLDLVQADMRKINAIRRHLLGQKDVTVDATCICSFAKTGKTK